VFAAVAAVVSAVGPGGLTLAAVGARVGLSGPALAQRFGSKHGLLLAFAAGAPAAVDRAFAPPAGTHPKRPLLQLSAGLRRLVAPITTPTELANHLALLHLDLVDDELRVHAVAHHRALCRHLERLLAAAVDAGELTEAPPVRVVAAAANGAMVTWAIDGRGALGTWVVRAVDDVLAPYRPRRPVSAGRPRRGGA